jgi:hypothetical protein
MRPFVQVPATSGGALSRRSPWFRVAAGFVTALLALGARAHTRGAEAPPGVDDFVVLADAIILEGSGKAQEAASKIAQHTFDLANEATAAALRGRILEDAGQVGPAWDVYEEARKRHPEDAALNLRRRHVLRARGSQSGRGEAAPVVGQRTYSRGGLLPGRPLCLERSDARGASVLRAGGRSRWTRYLA